MFRWEKTIESYLDQSNEDELTVDYFRDSILSKLEVIFPELPTLKWLEVGPGPCTKTMPIVDLILKSGLFNDLELSLLEPSEYWQNIAEDKLNQHSYKLYSERFEAFRHKGYEFDLITFFHVIYKKSLANAVIEYILDSSTNSNKKFIILTFESTESDFNKIRKRLDPDEFNIPRSQFEYLKRSIEKFDLSIQTQIDEIKDEKCHLNFSSIMESNEHWLFPFLIGTTPREFSSMQVAKKNFIHKTVKDYIKELDRHYFHVPDIALKILV